MTTGEESALPPEPAPERPSASTKPSVARAARLVRDKRSGQLRPVRGPGGRPRKGSVDAAEPAAPPITPQDEAQAALLGQTVWGFVAPMFRHRELTTEEGEQLGKALAPVMAKYLPMLGPYAAELNLGLVLFTLARQTKVVAVEPALPEPEPGPVETSASGIRTRTIIGADGQRYTEVIPGDG